MSAGGLTIAELERRARRPEQWTPALERGPLTLRLGCTLGAESWQWVAALEPDGKGATVRHVVVAREAFMRAMLGAVEETELIRDGLVRVRERLVAGAVVSDLVKSAGACPIKLLPFDGMVMDGSLGWLSWETGDAAVELAWPLSGPLGWRPLVEWARATRQRLHAIVCPGEPLEDF